MTTRFSDTRAPDPLPLRLHEARAVSVQPLSDEDDGRCYPGFVRGYTQGESITVEIPGKDAAELLLREGSDVVLHLTAPDGVRSCASRVLRHHAGPNATLELAWPERVARLNRRETVRVATSIAVDVSFTAADGRGSRVLRCTTTDLSEEGMRLMIAEPVEPGVEFSLRLHLPNSPEVFVCGGRVVRAGVSRIPGHSERPWLSIAFVNVAPALQRALRKFLWSVQRESLRKGVLP